MPQDLGFEFPVYLVLSGAFIVRSFIQAPSLGACVDACLLLRVEDSPDASLHPSRKLCAHCSKVYLWMRVRLYMDHLLLLCILLERCILGLELLELKVCIGQRGKSGRLLLA